MFTFSPTIISALEDQLDPSLRAEDVLDEEELESLGNVEAYADCLKLPSSEFEKWLGVYRIRKIIDCDFNFKDFMSKITQDLNVPFYIKANLKFFTHHSPYVYPPEERNIKLVNQDFLEETVDTSQDSWDAWMQRITDIDDLYLWSAYEINTAAAHFDFENDMRQTPRKPFILDIAIWLR